MKIIPLPMDMVGIGIQRAVGGIGVGVVGSHPAELRNPGKDLFLVILEKGQRVDVPGKQILLRKLLIGQETGEDPVPGNSAGVSPSNSPISTDAFSFGRS